MSVNNQFYYLRHGATSGNSDYQPLSTEGRQQAEDVKELVAGFKFATILVSPLKRAQETKQIVLGECSATNLQELKECTPQIGGYLIDSPTAKPSEPAEVGTFVAQVNSALETINKTDNKRPILVIAHLGTYLAIGRILKLGEIELINNCQLVRFQQDDQKRWSVHNESPEGIRATIRATIGEQDREKLFYS